MRNKKVLLAAVLVLAVCILFAACGNTGLSNKDNHQNNMTGSLGPVFAAADGDIQRGLAEIYGNNNKKTVVVAEVRDMSEGWYLQGVRLEGYPFGGIKCRQVNCNVMTYFNYARMRAAADDNNSRYTYFSIGDSAWYGGNEYVKYLKSLNIPNLFYGDITDEFTGSMNAIGKAITYDFMIDWEYKEALKAGDVILFVVDPLVDSASNDPERPEDVLYRAVISPLTGDHPEPYVAKFIDGKLQLPADLQDAFELKRLYDDTNPELTGIKDGDSVETVVNFLKAVEQDMIRYEQELKQLPASTDVSSIR